MNFVANPFFFFMYVCVYTQLKFIFCYKLENNACNYLFCCICSLSKRVFSLGVVIRIFEINPFHKIPWNHCGNFFSIWEEHYDSLGMISTPIRVTKYSKFKSENEGNKWRLLKEAVVPTLAQARKSWIIVKWEGIRFQTYKIADSVLIIPWVCFSSIGDLIETTPHSKLWYVKVCLEILSRMHRLSAVRYHSSPAVLNWQAQQRKHEFLRFKRIEVYTCVYGSY